MTHVDVQAKVTKTAAFTGTTEVDISGITADWTLVLEVLTLVDANARFAFEDTVDNFSAALAGPTVSVSGNVSTANPRRFTFTKKDFPNLRFGVTSAELRLSLIELKDLGSQSVTYQAWLEY